MSWIGPNSASKATLPWIDAATTARDAGVGNDVVYVEADPAIVAPNTRPQSTPPRAARFAVATAIARVATRGSSRWLRNIVTRPAVAGVGEEQLFERRLGAGEVANARLDEHA